MLDGIIILSQGFALLAIVGGVMMIGWLLYGLWQHVRQEAPLNHYRAVGTMALILLAMILVPVWVWAEGEPVRTLNDPMSLEWLKAIGFPTWALVLVYVGHRVVVTLHSFFTTLNQHVTQTERRLSRLEGMVFLNKSPKAALSDEDL